MSIQSEIARISDEVSNQASLISQIAAALEGKAGGSSSGTSVETCTVTLVFTGNAEGYSVESISCDFTKVVDGALCFETEDITEDTYTLTDVVVGSVLYVSAYDLDAFSVSTTGAILMRNLQSRGQIFSIETDAQITWS